MGSRSIPAWCTTKDAGRYVSVHPDTLRRMRREGRGPRFCIAGRRLIRYSVDALDEWLRSREVASNAEAACLGREVN